MSFFITLRSSLISFQVLTVALLLSASTRAHGLDGYDTHCWTSTRVELDTVQDLVIDAWSGVGFFQVEVSSPGVLLLEASSPGDNSRKPTIELLGKNCEPLKTADVTYVERSLRQPVIKVITAGTYQFRLVADPAFLGDAYRLRIDYSGAVPIRLMAAPSKTVDEWEEDDESLRIGFPETGPVPTAGEWEKGDKSLSGGAAPCDGTTASGEALLFFEEPGILAADAASADLVAFLYADGAAGTALGPSKELLAPVEPGSYLLRWTVSGDLPSSCEPRLRFYPTCGLVSCRSMPDRLRISWR